MKLSCLRAPLLALGLLTSSLLASSAEWAPDARQNAAASQVTRAELYAVLDKYLAALKAGDPSRVAWAGHVRNTENNVALMVGDGLWRTITALGGYDLRFADPQLGQVGFFGTVTETDETAAFTMRLKVVDGKVAEAETLVVRQLDSGIKFEGQKFENKPAMNEMLPAAQRLPRPRMICAGQRLLRHAAAQRRHAVHEVPSRLQARRERRADHQQRQLRGGAGGAPGLRAAVSHGQLPLRHAPARAALPAGGRGARPGAGLGIHRSRGLPA